MLFIKLEIRGVDDNGDYLIMFWKFLGKLIILRYVFFEKYLKELYLG